MLDDIVYAAIFTGIFTLLSRWLDYRQQVVRTKAQNKADDGSAAKDISAAYAEFNKARDEFFDEIRMERDACKKEIEAIIAKNTVEMNNLRQRYGEDVERLNHEIEVLQQRIDYYEEQQRGGG